MQDTLTWLHSFVDKKDLKFDPNLGLIKIKNVLEKLGNPHLSYKIIHIAGTSGKGTTAWMISYLLQLCGQKVGLTVSPHIVDIRERCMINNSLISSSDFDQGVNSVRSIINELNESFSFFEIMILVALVIFKQQGVGYVVIETGLGGRLDTTNILFDKICVITSIGLDHTKILGSTLDKIAYEKAMIVHKNNTCFTYSQGKEVDSVVREVVQNQGGILQWVDVDQSINMDHFIGNHNLINASLSLAVVQFIQKRDGINFLKISIKDCPPFLGRYTKRKFGEKNIIYDGAHNVQKITAFVSSIEEEFPCDQFTTIFACKEDKDLEAMLHILNKISSDIIVTSFGQGCSMSSVSKEQIENILSSSGVRYVYIENNHEAFQYALQLPTNHICITGSFFLVSELLLR